jgi:hypothetical protein
LLHVIDDDRIIITDDNNSKTKHDWLEPVLRTVQRGYISLKRVVRFVKEKRNGVPYQHTREY